MTDRRLEELLQRADEASDVPRLREQLAGRVVARVAQLRRRRDQLTASVACLALLIAVMLLMYPRVPRAVPPASVGTLAALAGLDPELARLRSDVDARLAFVAALRQRASERAEAARRRTVLEPRRLALLAAERGETEAAFRFVYQAAAIENDPQRRSAAIELYRLAVRLFPETAAASQAAARLSELAPTGA
ncbi:MAG: hypothetical protein CHACPFDD_03533 [Phycisphaerae bacterium]|nr:hypothetical protein [Phycisphaerae bacterium]